MAVSKRLRTEILRRDNSTCQKCGAKAPDVPLVVDHVIPVTLGGSDEPANLQALCEPCNSGKSATPPDAATVAKVADDANRWAKAMEVAADQMLGDVAVRDSARAAFDKKWRSWADGRTPVSRPNGWEVSVDRILKAGLPLSALLDCIDIAMSARQIKAEAVFRYACGAAWRKVDELQKAARAALGVTEVSSDTEGSSPGDALHRQGQYDLACSLFGNVSEEERERHRADAREYGDCTNEIDREITAVEFAFGSAYYDLSRLSRTIERLLKFHPAELVAECREFARDEYRAHVGEEPRDCDLLIHTVNEMEQRRQFEEARAYLDQLPSEERDEWVACATTLLGYDEHPAHLIRVEIKAAEYAQKNAADHTVMRGLCSARGQHGAMCPNRATHTMRLEACAGCGDPCGSHEVCERHLELLVDGKVNRRSTELPLVVADFEEIEFPQEEEAPF